MGENFLTTKFKFDNNKWVDDYWTAVYGDWGKRKTTSY